MDYQIGGEVALVTGASRGIGFACAEALAMEGAHVAICARSADALAEARGRISQNSRGQVIAIAGDIHNEVDRRRIFDRTVAELGHPSILIVNTPGGVAGFKPSESISDIEWDLAINAKFKTAVALTREVVGSMRERGWGRIVNLSTISALEPLEAFGLSNASRFAAIAFFRTLALEVGRNAVTVNSLAIGHTDTSTLSAHFAQIGARLGKGAEVVAEDTARECATGRIAMPIEIAAAVGFLCSRAASAITGQTIRVDCGFSRALLGLMPHGSPTAYRTRPRRLGASCTCSMSHPRPC